MAGLLQERSPAATCDRMTWSMVVQSPAPGSFTALPDRDVPVVHTIEQFSIVEVWQISRPCRWASVVFTHSRKTLAARPWVTD
jgi:hypothetical protein